MENHTTTYLVGGIALLTIVLLTIKNFRDKKTMQPKDTEDAVEEQEHEEKTRQGQL